MNGRLGIGLCKESTLEGITKVVQCVPNHNIFVEVLDSKCELFCMYSYISYL